MNPNIAQEGFGNHPEHINKNGRPPKIYTILKRSGYSFDDFRNAFHEISWCDIAELKRLFDNEKSPAIIKVLSHVFKNAIEKGDYNYIKDIIVQVIGQPKIKVDADIKMDYKITLNLNDNLSNNPAV